MKRTKNPAKEAEYRKRATDLVAQMTLHEKVSQMLSWAPCDRASGHPRLQLEIKVFTNILGMQQRK